jgi:hypothetical protein
MCEHTALVFGKFVISVRFGNIKSSDLQCRLLNFAVGFSYTISVAYFHARPEKWGVFQAHTHERPEQTDIASSQDNCVIIDVAAVDRVFNNTAADREFSGMCGS